MSNHPIYLDVDTLTSQILFIFSLFVDNVEIINHWRFQSSTPYSSKVIEIWKFDQNQSSRVKSAIWIYFFNNNYCSSHLFILKFGMGKFFQVRNQKMTLRRLKNKPVLRYSGSQYFWPDQCQKIWGQMDYWKKIFSSIGINVSWSQKWLLVLF